MKPSEKNGLVTYLATWFGSGYAPFAPGTFGTLAAMAPAYWIEHVWGDLTLLWSALLCFLVGIMVSESYMRQTGRDDPSEVVIDEVAGVWLLCAFLPDSFRGYAAGFIVFRFFDVMKPWPISLFDRRLGGGLGVMLDDILAALYPIGLLYAGCFVAQLTGHKVTAARLLEYLS